MKIQGNNHVHSGVQQTRGFDDEEGSLFEGFSGFGPSVKTYQKRLFRFFLDEDVGEPAVYRQFLQTCLDAQEGDVIEIFINCHGGRLDGCSVILEGIRNTEAVVRGVIVGHAHSAASMVALSCHELVVLDSADMMVHTASYGAIGKAGEVMSKTEFMTEQVKKLVKTVYKGFLTPDEIQDTLRGRDLWFNAETIRERLESRLNAIEEQETAEKPKKVKKTSGKSKKN